MIIGRQRTSTILIVKSVLSVAFTAVGALVIAVLVPSVAMAGLPAQCPPAKELAKYYVFAPLSQVAADRILVYKKSREMYLLLGHRILSHHKVALGFDPRGPKRQQGDGKTPEGRYFISFKNPNSSYNLSLKISYPDLADVKWARDRGVNPGGDIFIHGWPNDPKEREDVEKKHGRVDWTYGCIAVTNPEIENIYSMINELAVIDLCAEIPAH